MARWLVPVGGLVVLVAALAIGVAVWTGGDGGATACDRTALAQSIREGIAAADRARSDQFEPALPPGCGADDVEPAAREVTRDWHAMPGGIMMREATHTE